MVPPFRLIFDSLRLLEKHGAQKIMIDPFRNMRGFLREGSLWVGRAFEEQLVAVLSSFKRGWQSVG